MEESYVCCGIKNSYMVKCVSFIIMAIFSGLALIFSITMLIGAGVGTIPITDNEKIIYYSLLTSIVALWSPSPTVNLDKAMAQRQQQQEIVDKDVKNLVIQNV